MIHNIIRELEDHICLPLDELMDTEIRIMYLWTEVGFVSPFTKVMFVSPHIEFLDGWIQL